MAGTGVMAGTLYICGCAGCCGGQTKHLLTTGSPAWPVDAASGPAAGPGPDGQGGPVDTLPASVLTPALVSVGGTFDARLQFLGDEDWIAVQLTGGTTYSIALEGIGASELSDPYLRLYDATGALVGQNDDAGGTLDSRLTLAAPSSGTYYISARAYADASTGDYRVSVSEAPAKTVWTVEQVVEQLTEGYWSGADRRWAAQNGETRITYDVSRLTDAGARLAELALQVWAEVANVTFVAAPGWGALRFDDEDQGAYASYDLSGSTIIGADINISTDWLTFSGTQTASYSFQTYLHEIGHALGLGHAGNYNGAATYGIDNLYVNDSWQLSLMSYFSQAENTAVTGTEAWTLTPMIADIAAIQSIYGAAAARAGDTTYGVDQTAGAAELWEDGATPVARTIWDSGGIDLIDRSTDTAPVRIDLTPGAVSDVGGLVGTLAIALGVEIETARGGIAGDLLQGAAGANTLWGGPGGDTLEGRSGADHLFGGAGGDRLAGGPTADLLWGGTGDDRLAGSGGTDELMGEDGDDSLGGGAGGDSLFGGNGADELMGEDDDDWLDGGAGGDSLSGGAGDDRLIDLTGWNRMAGGAGADTLEGGGGQDTMAGDAGDDSLDGGSGNDSLDGGSGDDDLIGRTGDDMLAGGEGADSLNGGVGDDVLTGGEGADLLLGQDGADDLSGGGGWDTLRGGSGRDTLRGDLGRDRLEGGAGADSLVGGDDLDSLFGGAENDSLAGGNGADSLEGGAGDDWLAGGAGWDSLAGGEGNDRLEGGSENDQLDGGAGGDTLFGAKGNDTLIDLAGWNRLWGGEGNDRLETGAGSDRLAGEDGDDVLLAGGGDDRLTGDDGDDWLDGGSGADRLEGGAGHDRLEGRAGDDNLDGGGAGDTLVGGDGNDVLTDLAGWNRLVGGAGNDRLEAGPGSDVLFGEDGGDQLAGGGGNDRLDGGAGWDVLTGGDGADIFVFTAGQDRISDFQDGLDRLHLPSAPGLVDLAGGVRLDFASGSLVLEGVAAAAISAADWDIV